MFWNIHAPIEYEKDDHLGRRELARRIYARLFQKEGPPVLGIYGGGGTGKTSLLKNEDALSDRAISEIANGLRGLRLVGAP